ncbi:hypothetical protein AN958_09579 [Leucoagaricus sp. SymC.cos]|nr:hypothetical protein AN958_09579 [Leucoagaricus sp. SymC.cos]
MPPPPAYAGQHSQLSFPALYLYPLNDSFVPKHISLVGGQRVKIGRQTNPKTAPGEKNGFFDSKVLSRQHAEIWEEGGKIYIKDVKSSNGTFINGDRLSPEGVESDPYEVKSDDIVEFGIDIVGEDNKTIIHHKHSLMGAAQPGPNGVPSQFNFVGGPQQRRPGPNVGQGLAGIGGMGGSMRPPGKSGLTFEHILNRLQGELQKSRETGSELHSLTSSMNEVHDVLGGNMPSNIPPYPSSLPAVRPTRQPSPSRPQESHPVPSSSSPPSDQHPPPQPEQQPPSSSPPTTVISQLQSQLHDTQTSLAEHANKVRALEEVLADQDLIRKEIHDLRHLIENRRQEIMFDPGHDLEQDGQQDGLLEPRGGFDHDDDDDIQHIRIVTTIIPHELERVEEEDEEQIAAAERSDHSQVDEEGYGEDRADPIDPEREREGDTDRQRERQYEAAEQEALRKQEDLNVGRPRTPEPSFGLRTDDGKDAKPTVNVNVNSPRTSTTAPMNGVTTDEMLEQVLQLSAQLSAMAKLTSSMEAQYAAAQDTIKVLESKVTDLERVVKETNEKVIPASVPEPTPTPTPVAEPEVKENVEDVKQSLTEFFSEWKKTVEGQWSDVKEEWREERERMKRAREEWEVKMKSMDNNLDKMNQLHTTTTSLVKDISSQKQELSRIQERVQSQFQQVVGLRMANGEATKHGRSSGLVTPPSPRSQSSDSGGGRRRRKRRSASAGSAEGRGRSAPRRIEAGDDVSDSESDSATLASEGGGSTDAVKVTAFAEDSPHKNLKARSTGLDTMTMTTTGLASDGTTVSRAYYLSLLDVQKEQVFDYEDDAGSSFASEEEVEEGKKVPGPIKTHKPVGKSKPITVAGPQALPTPASLTASLVSELDTDESLKKTTSQLNAVNFQTAGAVVVLAVAAAAVFWKVRSE